jgi:hypothetical protein
MEVEGGELCNVMALETVVLYVILQPYVSARSIVEQDVLQKPDV